jgi:fucose 4-O-acetylase-like acetyltransferase
MAERDTYFDAVKGMMILSVINIHTVYWSLKPLTPDLMRELAYFIDIPIFFFISGYFAKHSSFLGTTKQAVHQLIRLYLKYLVIAALVAAGIVIWALLVRGRWIEGLSTSLLSIFSMQLTGELWGYFKGFYGNLWFLHTYFPLLLILPLLIGFPQFSRNKHLVLFYLLLLYLLMTYQYTGHIFLLREWGDVFLYGFFLVLGTVYRITETELRRKDVLLSFAVNCFLAWLIFQFDGQELRLSRYKFPPAFQWLVYSLLLVHIFVLVRPFWRDHIRPRIARLAGGLEWLGVHVFTVYLIQGLVCSIPYLFVDRLATLSESAWFLYPVVFAFNVALSIALTVLFIFFEGRVSGFFKRKNPFRSGKP